MQGQGYGLAVCHLFDKGLRGHSNKLCKVRFNNDIRKHFFCKLISSCVNKKIHLLCAIKAYAAIKT